MFLHVSVCPQGGWYPSMPFKSPGGGSPAPHPGGSVGIWPGGISMPTLGGSPGPHQGCDGVCIPACTEADPPPPMATTTGGTHLTGMHSCSFCDVRNLLWCIRSESFKVRSHSDDNDIFWCRHMLMWKMGITTPIGGVHKATAFLRLRVEVALHEHGSTESSSATENVKGCFR